MYFISAAVILLVSLALIVQVSLPYNNTGRASVLYNFILVFLRVFLWPEKNSRIHLDWLQNKYTNCKGIKNNTNFKQILEYKRNWIQHVNRMPRNRLPRVMKRYFRNWQKELWQTFEDTSGYVRPERVNKWPNSMTDIWWWWWWWH